MTGTPRMRSAVKETTALGAGYLAGLGVGLWNSPADVQSLWQAYETFHPQMDEDERESFYGDWRRAVDRSRSWAS